jgi:cytoskeleton protein RodZ
MAERRARSGDEQRLLQDDPVHYDGVGASLRHARLRLGLDLSDVAVALRIQQGHLDAVEHGRFQELPGPAYAVGFIRSYARYLRLDGEAAVAQFKAETSIAPGRGRLVAPEPIGEARRPRGLLIGLSLVLAAGVYAGWMWLQEPDRLNLELVAPPPQAGVSAPAPLAETAPPSAAPAAPALQPSSQAPSSQSPSAPPPAASPGASSASPAVVASLPPPAPLAAPAAPTAQDEAAPQEDDEEVEESTPPPTSNSLPGAPPPALPPQVAATIASGTGQTYGAANRDARVVIRATSESWVQVTGADNEILLTRTLKPGDSYIAPNRSDLKLWTGNAGALEILLDGNPLPPLGGLGVPKRDISLDPARLARAGG